MGYALKVEEFHHGNQGPGPPTWYKPIWMDPLELECSAGEQGVSKHFNHINLKEEPQPESFQGFLLTKL
jgi:hypothetical protein